MTTLVIVVAIAGLYAGAVGAVAASWGFGEAAIVGSVLLLLGLCVIGSWIAEQHDRSIVALGPDSTPGASWDLEELEV